jgi:hypothetical protein
MTLTEELKTIFSEVFIDSLTSLKTAAIDFVPKLAIGLSILFLGWLGAVLVRKIITKSGRAFGVDVVADKLGATAFLNDRDIHFTPSALLGWACYWAILLAALILSFERMDLPAAAELVRHVLLYLPRIVVAIVLLALGFFLSGVAGNFVDKIARVAHIPFHFILGQIARYGLIALAIANTLEYLDLASNTVLIALFSLVALAGLLIFIVFITSGKDLLGSLISQRFIEANFDAGDTLRVNGVTGTILEIGPVATALKTSSGTLYIPNREITNSIREKTSPGNINI